MKKNIVIVVLAVALLASLYFVLTVPSRNAQDTRADAMNRAADAPAKTEPGAPSRPSMTVTVAEPMQSALPITLAANGNIAAWQEATIGSDSSGLRLSDVRVNVGDTVKKGQVLATFTGETVQADVAQARAALAEAKAAASDAAGNAQRAKTLEKTGALSQQQINQYRTAAQTAQARVEAAEAGLAAQQVRGRNTTVRAPDDGVISAREATVGSVVNAGMELFRLIRKGRLEWRAQVTSAELGRIGKGTPVVVTGASGEPVEGQVRQVAPTVDPATREALVYVDLPKEAKANGVKAGMFARGEFNLGRSNASTVPQASVVPRDGFNYLLLLQPDNRVAQRKVETGRRLGDRIEITSELPKDAKVVVQGAGFLNDGDLVRVVDALPDSKPKEPLTPASPAQAAIK